MDLSKYSYFFRGFLPPEGFCIGVVAFVPSVSEVPSTFTELQDSLRNSWAPGVLLRLLAVPTSPANSGELANPDLSTIYLSSVLYLLRSETRISLHRVHPFTGAVINVLQKNTDYYPSPLQVSYVFLCISIVRSFKCLASIYKFSKFQLQATEGGTITARVAGVGRFSARAKNAINSFVKRIFANSQRKKRHFFAFNQKKLYVGIHAF